MYIGEPRTRRTFLVGLGRFMTAASLSAVVRPPVLYSFPSVLKPLNVFNIESVKTQDFDVYGQMYRIVFDIDNQVWLASNEGGIVPGILPSLKGGMRIWP